MEMESKWKMGKRFFKGRKMNFVILNLSSSSFFIIKILSKFGLKFYYVNENFYNKEKLKNIKNIFPIKFNNNKKPKRLLKYYDYGEDKVLYSKSSKYLSKKISKNLGKQFKNINNLKEKLRIVILSLFDFQSIGLVYVYHKLNFKSKKLIIIHNQLRTFIFKENGVNFKAIHLYYPLDEILLIINLLGKSLITFFRSIIKLFKNNYQKKVYNSAMNKYKKTGIIYHMSTTYGPNLYKKSHYFSTNEESALNIKNISLFMIGSSPDSKSKKNPNIQLIKSKFKIKYLTSTLVAFFKNIFLVRSFEQLIGLLIISIFLLKFNSWKSFFRNTNISNIIYDYDVLFPKSLSLALESLKIKTITIQERTQFSFGYIYTLIVNTYLYGGSLAKKLGNNNKSLIHENSFNIGLWRVTYFYNKDLVEMNKISFKSENSISPYIYKNKILFLGLFTDFQNNKPYLNLNALYEFLDYLVLFSKEFPDAALILRMKAIQNKDRELIMLKLKNIPNFYLCDDYRYEAISYRLCKEADLIVSLQTSLADEAIVYGKKVIFINDLYPIARMSEDTYPNNFHFAIPKDKKDMIILAKQCLENHNSINKKFDELKKIMSGDIDLSIPNIISKTLESYLQ